MLREDEAVFYWHGCVSCCFESRPALADIPPTSAIWQLQLSFDVTKLFGTHTDNLGQSLYSSMLEEIRGENICFLPRKFCVH